ncbi:MAG: SH3 domain-containing protein [Xanthobacteraceae bacterium]
MIDSRQIACAAGLLFLSTGLASAAPAVAATDLNVRAGEGTGYPVIAVMPAGEAVDVSGCADGWCYVRDYDGFASAAYLDMPGVAYGAAPVYVAPPAAVVVPGPVYHRPPHWNGRRIIRRGLRHLRRDMRQDMRQDRREARQERREIRQDRRQDRRERRGRN